MILGGTTEARELAAALATRSEVETVLSLAGRTADPSPQPVRVRIGGFGGVEGLAQHLRQEAFDMLIVATHPFAARISVNATEAAALTGISIFGLQRRAWQPVAGDRWIPARTVPDAIEQLGTSPRRVFLAIGRQEAHYANAAPQHAYLVRSVDPVDPPLMVSAVDYVQAKGPFRLSDELAMLRRHAIDTVVAKNSGGDATYAKIEAARDLGLETVMIERPPAGSMPFVETVTEALDCIDHVVTSRRNRGV